MRARLICFALGCAMVLAWPLRLLGAFPDRRFTAGDEVPWWIEARYPLSLPLKFGVDCWTAFNWRDGRQHVHRLEPGPFLQAEGSYALVVFVGAPTALHPFERGFSPPELEARAAAAT